MKKNIIMFGPSHGHNIEPFIDFFERNQEYSLTYIHQGPNTFTNFKNINFIPDQNVIHGRLRQVLRQHKGLIWVHGGFSWKKLLQLIILKNKESTLNINIWGELIPKLSLKSNLKAWIYRYIFKKTESIHFNWYSTEELLKPLQLANTHVFPWGLKNIFFKNESIKLQLESQKFIQGLNNESYNFFYPKSILSASSHDLIIPAAHTLKSMTSKKFKVYFWMGNTNDQELISKYKNMIKDLNLEDQIEFVKHGFLPFEDIKEIWAHIDCGLQIAKNDQLSTTLLEPMLMKKPVIASKIKPYEIFEDKFNTDLKLVELNSDAIAEKMKIAIEGQLFTDEELIKQQSIVANNFKFDENIERILEFFCKN